MPGVSRAPSRAVYTYKADRWADNAGFHALQEASRRSVLKSQRARLLLASLERIRALRSLLTVVISEATWATLAAAFHTSILAGRHSLR